MSSNDQVRGPAVDEDVPRRIRNDWRWARPGAAHWMNPKVDPHHEGHLIVYRDAWAGLIELGPFIESLQATADGLDDPEIELISNGDDEWPEVLVRGHRPTTDYDVPRLDAAAAAATERDREQYEALKAQFEPPRPGSSSKDGAR